jgi:hypothetical protein
MTGAAGGVEVWARTIIFHILARMYRRKTPTPNSAKYKGAVISIDFKAKFWTAIKLAVVCGSSPGTAN